MSYLLSTNPLHINLEIFCNLLDQELNDVSAFMLIFTLFMWPLCSLWKGVNWCIPLLG